MNSTSAVIHATRCGSWMIATAAVMILAGPVHAIASERTDPVATGWWWLVQTSPPSLPPPSNVEPGQLLVQSLPSGATAMAALRYRFDTATAPRGISLTVADGGDRQGDQAVLLACRTTRSWTSSEAGSWDERPTIDPEKCANGSRSADGSTWSFDVARLTTGRVIDVAIVPGVSRSTPFGTTFELVFEQPLGSLIVASAPGGQGPRVPTSSAPPPAPTSARPSSGGTQVPLDVDSTPLTSIPRAEEPPATAPLGDTASRPLPVDDPARWPGVVVLLGAVGAVTVLARRRPNQQGPRVDGVSRFVRTRAGSPPSLR